jgi:hypothetical protein
MVATWTLTEGGALAKNLSEPRSLALSIRGSGAWLAGRLARADFCTAHCLSTPGIRLFHIADDRPATVIYVHMLDADKLLSAITQASKNLNLGRISPDQTSRSRSEGDCDIREDLPKPKKG